MSLRADLFEYADVLEFAGQVLGPSELEQDCSWAHGMSAVLRLRDARGVTWFAKRHRDRDRLAAEITAYRQWVRALSGHAPRLHAADDSRSAIIVSAVPGEPVPWPAADLRALPDTARLAEQAVHREAGVLLRRLHDAQPPLPWDDWGAAKVAEFDGLMPMASQLLGKRDLALARAEVETLSGLPCPGRVPCHRDYTPRNWLADDGVQYVIDFEHARLDVWLADLARLRLGIWPGRPDLKEAFLDGYGRQLSDTDHAILHGVAALTATWLVVKAREIRPARPRRRFPRRAAAPPPARAFIVTFAILAIVAVIRNAGRPTAVGEAHSSAPEWGFWLGVNANSHHSAGKAYSFYT